MPSLESVIGVVYIFGSLVWSDVYEWVRERRLHGRSAA